MSPENCEKDCLLMPSYSQYDKKYLELTVKPHVCIRLSSGLGQFLGNLRIPKPQIPI